MDDELMGEDFDDDVEGDYVMGDDDDDEDDMDGDDIVGRRRPPRLRSGSSPARRRRRRRRALGLPRKPRWRSRMAAPGVPMPGVGLEPLPLTGQLNQGIFNAANPVISFDARPQRPFRAERLLASVVLTGGAAGTVLCDGIFIGTNLQLVELGAFDVSFFAPNAFGVRLKLVPAAPGILIRLQCRFNGTIGAGTAVTTLMFLGRTISG